MSTPKRRHKWRQAKRMDGTPIVGHEICRCGFQRWPSMFKDWYYSAPDGRSFSLYADETQPPCQPRSENP